MLSSNINSSCILKYFNKQSSSDFRQATWNFGKHNFNNIVRKLSLNFQTINSPRPKPKSNKNIAKEIAICWITGISIGFFPLVWNDKYDDTCIVHDIMNKNFVIFRFVFAVLVPSIILGYVYYRIYRIITKQVR